MKVSSTFLTFDVLSPILKTRTLSHVFVKYFSRISRDRINLSAKRAILKLPSLRTQSDAQYNGSRFAEL